MKKTLNSPFPFYLNDAQQNIFLCFGVSLFTVIFLSLYKPFPSFNIHNTFSDYLILGTVLCFALLINIILLPLLFPSFFDIENWNLRKYILFNIWLLFVVSMVLSLTSYFFLSDCNSIFDSLLSTYLQVMTIGFFPLFFVTFLIKNRMLAENLRNATKANDTIQEISHQAEKDDNNQLVTINTDTSDILSLKRHDFILAEAKDNYCAVHYLLNGKSQKTILRITLKNLESQLSNKILIRCHKSYLINVIHINSISGNSNGYRLSIETTDIEVPVSRAKGKEIIAQIEMIKDTLAIL